MTAPRGYCFGCQVYSTEAACFRCGGDMQMKMPPDISGWNFVVKPYRRDGAMLPEFTGHYPF